MAISNVTNELVYCSFVAISLFVLNEIQICNIEDIRKPPNYRLLTWDWNLHTESGGIKQVSGRPTPTPYPGTMVQQNNTITVQNNKYITQSHMINSNKQQPPNN